MTDKISHITGSDRTDTVGMLLRAIAFSAEKHRDQRRKGVDASPYINHCIATAEMVANVAGVRDRDILIAAVLHDTVEDTRTGFEELEESFGPKVRSLVREVTDDKTLPKAKRKSLQVEHAPHLSAGAKLIKIADKISNILDMSDRPPAGWSLERRSEYLEWAESVVAGCRGESAPLEALFDDAVSRARERLAQETLGLHEREGS